MAHLIDWVVTVKGERSRFGGVLLDVTDIREKSASGYCIRLNGFQYKLSSTITVLTLHSIHSSACHLEEP